MIPKIIHYCWFGNNEKSALIKKCINSFKELEEYKIIEWNEKNYDINSNEYVKEAYKNKKWAFVSDYVRLVALKKYGGIYLDTDVFIKKKFNEEFLNNSLSICFMFNCNLSTAIIGAEKNNKDICNLLDLYKDRNLSIEPNNDLFTYYFIDNHKHIKLNNEMQMLEDNIKIYPKEYFECPSINKNKGYAVHYFEGSWWRKNSRQEKIKNALKEVIPYYLIGNISRYKALKKSEFYPRYLKDKRKGDKSGN